MAPLSALTIYLFGGTCLLAGVYSLYSPTSGLAAQSLPASALPAYYGNALAAIAIGIYYALAAYQRNRAFFALTVPMRGLTATVFWSQGGFWKQAAIWEASGALLTGSALAWEGGWLGGRRSRR